MCYHGRLPRRRALQLVALAAGTILAGRRAEARAAGPYDGAFVDAHTHLKRGYAPPVEDLIAVYDQVGVKGVLLFGEPWSTVSDASAVFPSRIVPFLAEGYSQALHPDSSYMNPAGLNELLTARVVRGLGEVILRHSPYQLNALHGYASAPANNVPADDERLIEAYRLAGEQGVAVNVHQEASFADELERAVRAAPDTTFVWAHAGHGPASTLRSMLSRNPNLMADLSARSPWLGPGTVLLRLDGTLLPEWSDVLHEFPDRIVVGLDLFVPQHYAQAYVSQMVTYYRGILGQLEPSVAEMIGHQNAERIAPFAA
jgi:Tat protein secretion system quality control protein TatD with DNase activity